jgi:hypothetical protein
MFPRTCRSLRAGITLLLTLAPHSESLSPAAKRAMVYPTRAGHARQVCTLDNHRHMISSGCVAGRYTVRYVDRGGKDDPLGVHVSEACHGCPEGYYQNQEAAVECKACPAGKFQDYSSEACCFDDTPAPTIAPTPTPTLRPTYRDIGSHDIENCTLALLQLFPKVKAWPCASTVFTCDPKSCQRSVMGMIYSCMGVTFPNLPSGNRWANLKLTVEIADNMVASLKRHNWCYVDEVFYDQPGNHYRCSNKHTSDADAFFL